MAPTVASSSQARTWLTSLSTREGVLQIEMNGKLEIQLDGGTLAHPTQSNHDRHVDLWIVERTVSGVLESLSFSSEGVHSCGEGCVSARFQRSASPTASFGRVESSKL
jgi:hypothetical protein